MAIITPFGKNVTIPKEAAHSYIQLTNLLNLLRCININKNYVIFTAGAISLGVIIFNIVSSVKQANREQPPAGPEAQPEQGRGREVGSEARQEQGAEQPQKPESHVKQETLKDLDEETETETETETDQAVEQNQGPQPAPEQRVEVEAQAQDPAHPTNQDSYFAKLRNLGNNALVTLYNLTDTKDQKDTEDTEESPERQAEIIEEAKKRDATIKQAIQQAVPKGLAAVLELQFKTHGYTIPINYFIEAFEIDISEGKINSKYFALLPLVMSITPGFNELLRTMLGIALSVNTKIDCITPCIMHNRQKISILHKAIISNCTPQVFLDICKLASPDGYYDTLCSSLIAENQNLLHLAITASATNLIGLLIEDHRFTEMVRALGVNTQTTLHIAVRKGNIHTVATLLRRPDIAEQLDAKDSQGRTPYDYVNSIEMAKLFADIHPQRYPLAHYLDRIMYAHFNNANAKKPIQPDQFQQIQDLLTQGVVSDKDIMNSFLDTVWIERKSNAIITDFFKARAQYAPEVQAQITAYPNYRKAMAQDRIARDREVPMPESAPEDKNAELNSKLQQYSTQSNPVSADNINEISALLSLKTTPDLDSLQRFLSKACVPNQGDPEAFTTLLNARNQYSQEVTQKLEEYLEKTPSANTGDLGL